jgi:hypothetical protein|tara:strand:- start:421 stop:684 length:264 start_codon:yes stop_codon:yes gene_type:complete
MIHFSNTIEVECDNFMIEVSYDWRKGHAGDYLNEPEPDAIDIIKTDILYYITEESDVLDINRNIPLQLLPPSWEENIIEQIHFDVEK